MPKFFWGEPPEHPRFSLLKGQFGIMSTTEPCEVRRVEVSYRDVRRLYGIVFFGRFFVGLMQFGEWFQWGTDVSPRMQPSNGSHTPNENPAPANRSG